MVHNFKIRVTDDGVTHGGEIIRSLLILPDDLIVRVGIAVDFNYQFSCRTVEVNNVWPDAVLPAELEVKKLLVRHPGPKSLFGIRLAPP
ncbi:MAG: hypothetical protein Q7S23_02275 [bacterium]|nr:hypothetical protein [bacterium]